MARLPAHQIGTTTIGTKEFKLFAGLLATLGQLHTLTDADVKATGMASYISIGYALQKAWYELVEGQEPPRVKARREAHEKGPTGGV